MTSPRGRAQAIAVGRGGQHTLAVPLVLRLAARIAERPLEEFFTDPTQLANGLRDLLEAVGPDGLVVTLPDVLDGDPGERLECALEATRRLRPTVGDRAALIAVLGGSGPVVDCARAFLSAGIDGIVLTGPCPAEAARTVGNVSRFHRAVAHAADVPGLPPPTVVALAAPHPGVGLVITDGEVPADTALPIVEDWVRAVHS
ncbi:MAG: hypothetical protein H0V67_10820 [Geodermatophilaceae bacterium]|nr:hypothetical protein [Geodermatophilaceae bacterium]